MIDLIYIDCYINILNFSESFKKYINIINIMLQYNVIILL